MGGRGAYLSDAECSPFLFPEQLQCSMGRVMVIFRDGLEHGFGKLHMPVLVLAVRVSRRGKASKLVHSQWNCGSTRNNMITYRAE